MNSLVAIEKISIDKKGIFSIKIHNEKFPMIYRSAMGVYWDENTQSVFSKYPIKKDIDIIDTYKQIVEAIISEYGMKLCISGKTTFENIKANSVEELMKLII